MNDNRRSFLQAKIILQLEDKPPKTLSELAVQVKSQRSSVSRSMQLLKAQGVVFRGKQGWHLTDNGKTEAFDIKEKFTGLTTLMKEFVDHTPRQAMVLSSDIGKALTSSTIESIIKVAPSSDLSRITNQLSQVPWNADIFSTFTQVNETLINSVKPILELQNHTRDLLLNTLTPITSQLSLISETILNNNNLRLTETITNILALKQNIIFQSTPINWGWLIDDISSVTKSFTQVYKTNIVDLDTLNFKLHPNEAADRLVVPGITVANYTGSIRNLLEADIDANPSENYRSNIDEYGDQKLDEILYLLNPNFVEMRQGSWAVLQQAGPDRLRQAAVSQRELINQLFQYLVPNDQLAEDNRNGPQVKARVRKAIGASESDAEFIVSVSEALTHLYDQLNKYTHRNENREASLRGVLHTGEGLICFILSIVEMKKRNDL